MEANNNQVEDDISTKFIFVASLCHIAFHSMCSVLPQNLIMGIEVEDQLCKYVIVHVPTR